MINSTGSNITSTNPADSNPPNMSQGQNGRNPPEAISPVSRAIHEYDN